MTPAAYALGAVALVGLARGAKALLDAGDRRACAFANRTDEDESEWLYDNRERAHMETCLMCNPEAVHAAWDLAFRDEEDLPVVHVRRAAEDEDVDW